MLVMDVCGMDKKVISSKAILKLDIHRGGRGNGEKSS